MSSSVTVLCSLVTCASISFCVQTGSLKIPFTFLDFHFILDFMFLGRYVHVNVSAYGNERPQIPQGLEFQALVSLLTWVWGTEFNLGAGTASASNCSVMSLAPF